ncbi:MAG TPA: MarC family protein [Terriglobales bacterium]|jgi:multiple antibiotic resistance protein|nr:MarC family protein [Terriglobales bacterium]
MMPGHAVAQVLKTLPSAAAATFLALFPIVNPFGGVPLFFALTAEFPAEERNRTALKTAMYVFAILVVFMFFGRFVLNFFGISLPVLKVAGGLIVAHTAWGMVTASTRITPAERNEAAEKSDISLTPMAMPMLSGPGSIGVVMGLAANAESMTTYMGMVIGIAALALSVFLFLRLGGPLVARLGPGAVAGITRIFGFLIFAVAVQLVWDGAADFGR